MKKQNNPSPKPFKHPASQIEARRKIAIWNRRHNKGVRNLQSHLPIGLQARRRWLHTVTGWETRTLPGYAVTRCFHRLT